MKDVYFILAAVSYGIFVVQFIMSLFFGDIDVDGGDADFDVGSLFSFKGVIHFLMGFSGWLFLADRIREVQWWDYGIGVLIGLIFVLVLFFLYKLCMKLQHHPSREEGLSLLNKVGTIYIHTTDGYIIQVEISGQLEELNVKSLNQREYESGSRVRIIDYKEGEYYIN